MLLRLLRTLLQFQSFAHASERTPGHRYRHSLDATNPFSRLFPRNSRPIRSLAMPSNLATTLLALAAVSGCAAQAAPRARANTFAVVGNSGASAQQLFLGVRSPSPP